MEQKITALKSQKRNRQRINVYLDGEFAFGLSRITAAWLEVGQKLSDEKIKELQAADEIEIAYQRSLNTLSYRPRSEKEIWDNLRKHGTLDEVIENVIERLRRNRLVDDKGFAREWVKNRSEFRPRGKRALTAELRKKGIKIDIINSVLQDIDEDELAYQAAIKQSRKYRRLDWKAYRVKMLSFLARRGFNYEVARPVVEKVWKVDNSPTKHES
jgi:regulatory protein